jgi:uncharacterized circularly permuted ATP-grasp superfamily protein/uncharacterized alpha-E superfamily protein
MDYDPRPDRYDEIFDANGQPRAHWKPLAQAARRTSRAALARRANTIRRAVEQDGVTYNIYGDPKGMDRPWEVDLLPFVIPDQEWQLVCRAVEQRARLLNLILADLYGPGRLIAEGLIPPAIIHGHHNYLWPCRGIQPPNGTYLHLYACDLARSPDGRWWVIGDRTQAPSGAGYAVQNRLIVTPLYESVFRSLGVQRLAGFFRRLQEHLGAIAPARRESPFIALLTPGPYNETYFEQVFLARYLGFTLVEGSDLTVRDNCVYLKTLEGLRRVDVLLRRIDDEFSDPAALRADSTLGVPGLLTAIRSGNVVLANALGTGVLETPAIMGFLPAICEMLLGAELVLPSVATWWCGEAPALDYVVNHLPDLVIKPTFPSMRLEPTFGHTLGRADRATLTERLQSMPHAFVAQEWVRLSQVPTWSRAHGRFEPRVVGLRVYAAASGDGYEVMPGGLARIAPESTTDVISMQRGGSSKDVWVLGSRSGDWQSLLTPNLGADQIVREGFSSRSRAVENLFWLGRYSERLEGTGRLLRAIVQRLVETDLFRVAALNALAALADRLSLRRPAGREPGQPPPPKKDSLEANSKWLLGAIGDRRIPNSIAANAARLLYCATQLRDRLSLDNWRTMQRLAHAHEPAPRSFEEALAILDAIVPRCTALTGYALDDMTRDDAWRFLMTGRHLERIAFFSAILPPLLALPYQDCEAALSALLEIGNVNMTYRARYQRRPELLPVLHLLVLDELNPHSVSFQLASLGEQLDVMKSKLGFTPIHHPASLLQTLRSVDLVDLEKFPQTRRDPLSSLLAASERMTFGLSDELAQRFFVHTGERPQTSVAA